MSLPLQAAGSAARADQCHHERRKVRALARVTLAPSGTGFVVDVEDEGPGIAEAEKSRVFEPYYRTESGRDSDSRGMGLGLAIARSVILGHGGTIELLDREPRGLRVHIVLPEAAA